MPKGHIGNMDNIQIAKKYLNLIILLILCIGLYHAYRSNLFSFIGEQKHTKAVDTSNATEVQKQKQTFERIKSLENYLDTNLQELKALEASSSIDLSSDLYLNNTYLKNLEAE